MTLPAYFALYSSCFVTLSHTYQEKKTGAIRGKRAPAGWRQNRHHRFPSTSFPKKTCSRIHISHVLFLTSYVSSSRPTLHYPEFSVSYPRRTHDAVIFSPSLVTRHHRCVLMVANGASSTHRTLSRTPTVARATSVLQRLHKDTQMRRTAKD